MTPIYVLLHCKIPRIMVAKLNVFKKQNFVHLHDYAVASCQGWSKLPRLPEK
jgi:hypothetical protein